MLPIRCPAGGRNAEVTHAGHCVTCHPVRVSCSFAWTNRGRQQGYTVSPLSPWPARKPRVCAGRTGHRVTHRTMLSAPLLQSRSAPLEPLASQGTRKQLT